MAPPLPTTFDRDSPMSPQSSISYQTNVNRQKTKKWTDAKPANYGGDDWGSDDDYDAPPPPSKPAGFRQQGQALRSPDTTAADNQRKYGELPPLPGANIPRGRAHSFDADDEKRNFSSGNVRQPSPRQISPRKGSPRRQSPRRASPTRTNAPATRFSQIPGVSTARNASGPPALSISTTQPPSQASSSTRKPSQGISPISGSPHPDILQPGRAPVTDSNPTISPQSDTRSPSTTSDYQARRDFSPSAVPPPLATRGSPAPQSATESPSARFPARKSSLSQVTGSEETIQRPWLPGGSASPTTSTRSPMSATAGKALPFIRPADIYRRVEEEKKEKERQSMESAGRPSIDSLVGGRPSDLPESPAKPHLREKSSSDSLGAGSRRKPLDTNETSDSSRRLMPSLHPVQERKSEYGFDNFDINNSNTQLSTQPEADQLAIEEARRQSVSPKLPDLNRISGFGMDIFTKPTVEDPIPQTSEEIDTTPTASSNPQLVAKSPEDMTLKNQPSVGFKSVVNQAFDRSDDSSIPNTPASQAGSGVKRTDSESTGTAGISPIISRVSSTANPESRNRDLTTPSIPEAVNEPHSPGVSNKREITKEELPPMPAFKQGHRRDISTPSPGNSPARTLDIAIANIQPDEHHAIVADASAASEDAIHSTSRPVGEREQSFRPVIPGGWTSYTNTDVSEASTEPAEPQKQSTPPRSPDDGDLELTPTTAKHLLPETAHEAAIAGAAVLGATGVSLDRQDSPARSEVQLPTPDLSMAPSGNLYSTSHPDPRLGPLPTLEKAPPETQLRPDVVDRPISVESVAPPPPPPKDSPLLGSEDSDLEHFQKPFVPLKQRNLDQVTPDESHQPSQRPSVLPALSTDSSENDQESDKLAKEIVRSLSPRTDGGQQESTVPDTLDDDNAGGLGRESTYLPSEYDNYWASTAEEENPVPTEIATKHIEEPTQVTPTALSLPSTTHADVARNDESLNPRPLTPRKPDEISNPDHSRPQLQNRFSWEKSSNDVTLGSQHGEPTLAQEEKPAQSIARVATSGPSFISTELPDSTELSSGTELQARTELSGISAVSQLKQPTTDDQIDHSEQPSISAENHHIGRDAAILAGAAAALGTVTTTGEGKPSQQASRRLSLAEEKDPLVSSYPVSPSPPESEHPARSPKPYFPPEQQTFVPPPPSTVSPINSPIVPHAVLSPTHGKFLSFKEIAAMKSPQQRIRTFDETRHRFAGMDTGLNDWMARLQAQHPEHAGATGSWGGSRTSYPSGSARSKFSKAPGGAPPPLQQPYYQQYLNASSPTVPSPSASRPGPSVGPSTQTNQQQGISPAGNKLTSQQVQAKGKELLHTAGVFGGKAGKASKGLLAKGRNKLRGSSGGDKEMPPPPKPKADRRTSWGLPLSLSKSSGKPDDSPRSTEESVAMPAANSQRERSITINSATYTLPQLPGSGNGSRHSLDTRSGALSLGNAGMQQPSDQAASSTTHEDEVEDTLAPPAPLSKLQPSWDPLYTAPIAEEEVTQFPEPPRRAEVASESPPRFMQSGPIGNKSRSERSNSEDAKFYDAQEDTVEADKDWVMVEPNPESKTGETGDVPTTTSNIEPAREDTSEKKPQAEEEPKRSLDRPRLSIMDRPRGSIEISSTSDTPMTSLDSSRRHRAHGSSSSIPSPPLSPPARSSLGTQPAIAPSPAQQQQPAPIPTQYSPVQSRFPSSQPTQVEPEKSASTSSFLPPIRRTSTFGLGFGSRHAKPRFPIDDDDDEDVPGTSTTGPQSRPQSMPVTTVASTVAPDVNKNPEAISRGPQALSQEPKDSPPQITDSYKPTPPPGPVPNQQQRPVSTFFTNRPPLGQSGQPQQHQRVPSHSHPPPVFIPQGGVAALQRPEFTQSHVEWKPNRPKVVTSPSQGSAAYWKEQDIPPPQNSWEPQHQRRTSNSSQRLDEKSPWPGSVPQPPSAANRYPELFRQDQTQSPSDAEFNKEIDDPPSHIYQAPIPRTTAFLPRQQGTEYQLPGVGPPPEQPQSPGSRRNSGLWKELGGRLSRGSSRERGNSVPREGIPDRNLDSRGNEETASTVTSDEGKDKQKRRSSFFGSLNRSSTGGLASPQSRESTVAHNPGSRTDLLASGQPSPISQHERKRSFFGGTSSPVESKKSNKLMRASTGGLTVPDESGKKKRFSGLSGLFKGNPVKDSPQQRPQSTREVSYEERQPLESPQLSSTRPPNSASPLAQHQDGLRSHSGQYPPVNFLGAPAGGSAGQGQRPRSNQEQSLAHNKLVPGIENREPVARSQLSGQRQSRLHVVNQDPSLPAAESTTTSNPPILPQATLGAAINYGPEIVYEPPPGPPPSQFLRQASNLSTSSHRSNGQAELPRVNSDTPPTGKRQNSSTLLQVGNPSLINSRNSPGGGQREGKYGERPLSGRQVSGNLPANSVSSSTPDIQRQYQNHPSNDLNKQPDSRGQKYPPNATRSPSNISRQGENAPVAQSTGQRSSVQQRDAPNPARGSQQNPRFLSTNSSPATTMKTVQADSRANSSPTGGQRQPSTTRNVLTRLTGSGSAEKPRQESKSRKQSGSGFMSGLINRKSKDDRSSEDSRSQGSQPRSTPPQFVPRAQTYTDLQQQEPYIPPQQQEAPVRDPNVQPQERGRRMSREPQYDTVPIPGGYSLVRGQGAIPVPTEYDPRGLNRPQQQSYQSNRVSYQPQSGPPQNSQVPSPGQYQGYPPQQQHSDVARSTLNPDSYQIRQTSYSGPNLAAPETYSRNRSAPRRLSREDMLARSPPKSPEGQQRPYQLTLPDTTDEDRPPPISKEIPNFPTPPKNDTIQCLQKPILRHPESPAGYPLPEDDVFSPVNDAARDFPAPPPPKWPGEQQILLHARHPSVSTVGPDSAGLDRSNTHRTAVSAVSGLSGPQDSPRHSTGGAGALSVPNQREERPGHVSSPSPTPPSPLPGTPERNVSPERDDTSQEGQGQIKTTVLEVHHPNRSDDLYDASPRLPKPQQQNRSGDNTFTEESEKENSYQNGQGYNPRVSVEEKIPYQPPRSTEGLAELDDHEPGATMSATSYPGQEWVPAAWED